MLWKKYFKFVISNALTSVNEFNLLMKQYQLNKHLIKY